MTLGLLSFLTVQSSLCGQTAPGSSPKQMLARQLGLDTLSPLGLVFSLLKGNDEYRLHLVTVWTKQDVAGAQ